MPRIPPKRRKPPTESSGLRIPTVMKAEVDRVADELGRSLNATYVHLIRIGLEEYLREQGKELPPEIAELDLTSF